MKCSSKQFLFLMRIVSFLLLIPIFSVFGIDKIASSSPLYFSFSYQPYSDRIQYVFNYLHDPCEFNSESSGLSMARYIGFTKLNENLLYYFYQFGGEDLVEIVSMGGGPPRSAHDVYVVDRYGYPIASNPPSLVPIPHDCFYRNSWDFLENSNNKANEVTSRYFVLNPPFTALGIFWIIQVNLDSPSNNCGAWLYSTLLGLPLVSASIKNRSNNLQIISTGLINGFSKYPCGMMPGDKKVYEDKVIKEERSPYPYKENKKQ